MTSSAALHLRPIESRDDGAIAAIIRQTLVEYGANRPGFAWADPELDRLSQVYTGPGARYLVAELEGTLVGGAGIAPFACHLDAVCELQKMYLGPLARGRGVGQALISALLPFASEAGYRHCYLETFGPMTAAQALYRKNGFEPLAQPWGDSGHTACDCWFAKKLERP
ncbi:GNAT family N-acetyltransferase [Ferrimonas balearica]|uniref:GNAT family N-acetyltransferase n=1 Tax=Ferrimonas balearica TaxID=44012 RepID=UPI001C99245B|nr:GNAT family N-acetyltransferase [Ferrimonas balearica]MBY5991851.1 GNAT family N-acetyltransferase [Ferrimonas balearica]